MIAEGMSLSVGEIIVSDIDLRRHLAQRVVDPDSVRHGPGNAVRVNAEHRLDSRDDFCDASHDSLTYCISQLGRSRLEVRQSAVRLLDQIRNPST